MPETGLVFDVERFAVHDGPGIRTVVFLKGCPLRCVWCHSPESQGRRPELAFYESLCIGCGTCERVCPHGAQQLVAPSPSILSRADGEPVSELPERVAARKRRIDCTLCQACGSCASACPPRALEMKGTWRTVDQVVREVERDAVFYRSSGGGVTISGGEPTCQPGFLRELLRELKERGLHVALETCGLAPWAVFERIVPLVDLFLYDVKHLEPEAHRRLTGVSNQRILENLAGLAAQGREVQVRVPLVLGLNDAEENVAALGAFMRKVGLRRVALLPYNPSAGAKYRWLDRPYPLEGLEPLSAEAMEALRDRLRSMGLEVE